jgi:YggT family protein
MMGANGNDFVSEILCLILLVMMIVLFIRVILDWVALAGWRPPHTGPVRAALDVVIDVTEPPLRLLRRIVPPTGGFDLSVLVAFVALTVLRTVVC